MKVLFSEDAHARFVDLEKRVDPNLGSVGRSVATPTCTALSSLRRRHLRRCFAKSESSGNVRIHLVQMGEFLIKFEV